MIPWTTLEEEQNLNDLQQLATLSLTSNFFQSAIQVDDDNARSSRSTGKARDRANPLARTGRKNAVKSAAPDVTGQAFNIRGAANNSQSKAKLTARIAGAPGAAGGSGPSTAQGMIGVLKRVLASRWNGPANYLNLDRLADDAILKENDLTPPGQPKAHKDIGRVLFKLVSENFPSITTLSLANNEFKTLGPVAALPEYLPDLQNLSLQGNDLKWTKDLSVFSSAARGGKLKNLRELILTGNPMQTNAASAMNQENYRSEVIAKFPTLTLLDGEAVTPKESAVAKLPSGKGKGDQILTADMPTRPFPLAVKAGFSDEHASAVVPAFLHKFFTLFDTDRSGNALRAVYASNATWSLVLNRHVPPRAKSAGYLNSAALPRQRDLNWAGYKNVTDHNIMGLGARAASRGLPVGAHTIIRTLEKLPATTHPLTDASKFVVDSWLLPNAAVGALLGQKDASTSKQALTKPEAVLFISVKGEFQEGPSYGLRSFERTFIVSPSAPGSAAQTEGWAVTILAEQWTVKHYTGSEGWRVGSLGGEAAPAATSSQQPPHQDPSTIQPAPGLTPEQHQLSLDLSSQTGLTYPFAVQCLQENGWQPQAAMTVFANLKAQGSIPAEAFQGGVVPS